MENCLSILRLKLISFNSLTYMKISQFLSNHLKKNVFFILVIIFYFIFSHILSSQNNFDSTNNKFFYIGPVGGFNYVWNETQIPCIDGENCGKFRDGTDIGYFVGITGIYDIISGLLSIEGRVLYDVRPVSLTTTVDNFTILDPETDKYVPFVRDFSFEGNLNYLVLDLGIRVKPFDYLPISFKASFDAGNPVFGKNYSNIETIVSPNSISFPDAGKSRTIDEGELQDAGTALGVSGGLAADFYLNDNILISPEVTYRYGLNSVMSSTEWNTNILRIGASIVWKIDNKDSYEEPEEPFIEEEVIVEEPEIIVEIDEPPVSIEKDTVQDFAKPDDVQLPVINNISSDDILFSETIVTETYPLLPYIFFDSSSANIKPAYINSISSDNFDEHSLPKNTLGIYYNLLDILGHRLAGKSKSILYINGTTDGIELTDINSRAMIAEKRANAVKDYFVNKWKINPDRLKVSSNDKPEKPTSEEYMEGFAENRRVELYSDDPDILMPVIHSRFNELIPKDRNISVEIDLNRPDDVTAWTAKATSNGKFVEEWSGIDPPENLNMRIDFRNENSIINSESIDFDIKLELNDGSVQEGSLTIPVQRITEKYEVGRLNLIVFDFNSSEITDINSRMLNSFLSDAIKDNSHVNVIGSTDKLGELKYNMNLSKRRAVGVKDFIAKKIPKVKFDEVKGIGPSDIKYDNSIPEGRFYCRTVLVEVHTPFIK